jgi:hypothetical protein
MENKGFGYYWRSRGGDGGGAGEQRRGDVFVAPAQSQSIVGKEKAIDSQRSISVDDRPDDPTGGGSKLK